MRIRWISVALVSLAAAACGSDDEGEKQGTTAQRKAAPDCVAQWNEQASADQRAKASLSHRGDAGEPVLVGRYTGAPFTATGEGFDAESSPTTAEVSVAKGDCAAVDLTSNDTETNWVMVLSRGGDAGTAWWFLPTDEKHPLADPPQPLEGTAETIIAGFGEEAKLTPKP